MKSTGRLIFIFLVITAAAFGRATPEPGGKGNLLSMNECIAKGGIGIINRHLYIDLWSTRNELILTGRDRWVGNGEDTIEVVFYFDNKIWAPTSVQADFELSKAVIVSFEKDKVRFFDFSAMSGGYYRRKQR